VNSAGLGVIFCYADLLNLITSIDVIIGNLNAMSAFVNVLEEIIIKEIYTQIEEIRPEIQPKIKVVEVLAYALNRLPPLFSTSITGYQYQYDYALNELHPQISQLVKHGIKTVLFGDPLHDLTPLPNSLFTNSAGVLYELSKILNCKYLRWRDVPVLVKELSNKCSSPNNTNHQTRIQSDESTRLQDVSHLSSSQKALLSSTKRFAAKQLAHKKQEQDSLLFNGERVLVAHGHLHVSEWTQDKKIRDAIEIEYRALRSYTLEAQLGLINVLEHLVFRAIERISTPELYAQINQPEVAAYALNRLPPMYATSDRGFKFMRQKAVSELARELIGAVRTGVMKVMQIPHSDAPPIYAYQFEREYEQTMLDLNRFLNRDDISLNNIVAIAQDLLNCHERLSA
jgi:hypothetical protein